MINRRSFIAKSSLLIGGTALSQKLFAGSVNIPDGNLPIVISTWNHGLPANEAAWKVLEKGGHSLDAVEAGVLKGLKESVLAKGPGDAAAPHRGVVAQVGRCVLVAKDVRDNRLSAKLENPMHLAKRRFFVRRIDQIENVRTQLSTTTSTEAVAIMGCSILSRRFHSSNASNWLRVLTGPSRRRCSKRS